MLRMSTLLLRTLRDDPADAEVASHKLLVNKQTNLKQMHEPAFMKKIQRKKKDL